MTINRTIIVERDSRATTTRVMGIIQDVDGVAEAARRVETAAEAIMPFADYEIAFEAASADLIPESITRISAFTSAGTTEWRRDPAGTCLGGGWSPADIATPQHWGAVGDGVADDTAALQAAFAWMEQGNALRDYSSSTYRTTSAIKAQGHVDLDMSSATLLADFTSAAIDLRDENPLGPYPLTANYTPGTLTVAVSTLPRAPLPGERIRLFSLARDPVNRRDAGSNGATVAEWAYAGVGSTTTNIVLTRPLRVTEGMHDGSRVPAYTLARSASVVLMQDAHKCRARLPKIIRDTSPDTPASAAVNVMFFRGAEIKSPVIDGGSGSGIALFGTDAATIDLPDIRNLANNAAIGVLGYGISDAGHGTNIRGGAISRTRHAYTTAAARPNAEDPSMVAIVSTGRIMGATLNSVASLGGLDSALDTHHGAEGVTLTDCVVHSATGLAYGIRGQNIHLQNPRSTGGALGIRYFTDSNGGQWLAGDDVEDYTHGSIANASIRSSETPLETVAASVRVSGVGEWVSDTHRAIRQNGGDIILDGHQRFKTLGGAGAADTGCLDTFRSVAGSPFTMSRIIIEGCVEIDARAATAGPIFGIRAQNNTEVLIRGRLLLRLPSGASVFGGGGTIRTEYGGLIEYSLEGSSGIIDSTAIGGRQVTLVHLPTGQRHNGGAA